MTAIAPSPHEVPTPHEVQIGTDIAPLLRSFTLRRRGVALYRALGAAVAAALALALVACLLDRFLRLPGLLRLFLLLCDAALIGIIVQAALRRWMERTIPWHQAAAEVEQADPALRDRLQTVASQLLAPSAVRGSPQMLESLRREVAQRLQSLNARTLAPAAEAVRPWIMAGLLFVTIGALCCISWLDMPRLLARFVLPLAPIDPVTTTRLTVVTGDIDVVSGQPFTIVATGRNVGDEPPTLHFASDGQTFSAANMTPDPAAPSGSADVRYTFAFVSVDHDTPYFVTAGDARTPRYQLSAVPTPAVTEFRVQYVYPKYTGVKPFDMHNTDGVFEALTGAEAHITLIANTPLDDATLKIDGVSHPMAPALESNARQISLPIDANHSLSLSLRSQRGIIGAGPSTMTIRAVPDRAPIIHLLAPAQDLQLSPRDRVSLEYHAIDDYGVTAMAVQLQINQSPAPSIPLKPYGDPRQIDGRYDLDLAGQNVHFGDVVSVQLLAIDGDGHHSLSPEIRRILISPASIDAGAHIRMTELAQAQALAAAIAAGLNTAAGQRGPDAFATLISTADLAQQLSQSLLRVIVHSDSPAMSEAVAMWLDRTQELLLRTQRLANYASSFADEDMHGRAGELENIARQMQGQLQTVAQGALATALAAERQDAAATSNQPTSADANSFAGRLQRDVQQGLVQLQIDPNSPNVAGSLTDKINAAQNLMRGIGRPDFVGAAHQWIDALNRPDHQPALLDGRLEIAAQAQGLRPDADYQVARDLEVSARACAVIDQTAATTQPITPPIAQYPDALAALMREAEVDRGEREADAVRAKYSGNINDSAARSRADEPIHAAAVAAREKMLAWAGDPSTPTALDASQQEDAALAADAAMEQGKFDQARKFDSDLASAATQPSATQPTPNQGIAAADQGPKLTGAPSSPQSDITPPAEPQTPAQGTPMNFSALSGPAVPLPAMLPMPGVDPTASQRASSEMAAAQQIAQLENAQRELQQDTASAGADRAAAKSLAQRQQAIANAAGDVHHEEQQADDDDTDADDKQNDDDTQSRQAMIAAISAAQQRLAEMPQQIAEAQGAAAAAQRAKGAADAAHAALAAAPADHHDAAAAVARQADAQAAEAHAKAANAGKDVAPDESDAVSAVLSKYRPETSAAADVIDQRLTPALRQMQQALAGDDADAVDRSASAARAAIEAAQAQLRTSEQTAVDQDPLVAAQWFAHQAAKELAAEPPNPAAAQNSQRQTAAALAAAQQQSIQKSGEGRLATVPKLSPLLMFYSDALNFAGQGFAAANASAASTPFTPQWGHLQQHNQGDLNDGMRESDPAGYEDSLRAYFDALGAAKGKGQ